MNYPMLDDGTRDWCRTCAHYVGACESDCTYQRNENGLDYDKEPTMYQQKPISNADRLRAMSDEQLAELFASWIQDCGCNNVPCQKSCEENHQKWLRGLESVSWCKNNWLCWLKEEASL